MPITPEPTHTRRKKNEVDVAAAVVQAALLSLGLGQSSVELTLDSKGQVKPTVHVYHRLPAQAAKIAEAEFDRLLDKYQPKDAKPPMKSLPAAT